MKIKRANIGGVDFSSNDVRRLHGILMSFKNSSSEALNEMNDWLDNEPDISFEEAKIRLDHYLSKLNLK
jgi:hypothetical protein